MKEITVTVNGQAIRAMAGENLSDVLSRHGFTHPRPCGGRGVCGKCTVSVNGQPALACQTVLREDICVTVRTEGAILSESGAVTNGAADAGDALVLDLGTTTLALALLSTREKKILRVIHKNNPQRHLGADVITRIEYATKHGVTALTEPIRDAISAMIRSLGCPEIDTLTVAGNTTMLHLLLGVDPTPMGVAPYTPAFVEEKTVSAASLGICGVRNVRLLPSVAAFVGADLVAGVHYVGLPEKKYSLLIDLGTNAEILLFSRGRILSSAAAAGPCFEGANISCGMSATEGAIYAYGADGCKTIGGTAPRGLCGTGLVDVISYLLEAEILDESGYMEDDDYPLSDGVSLSQGDVRQYQLAKSAVYSAILSLMAQASIGFSEIEHLYIAGGFAAKIDIGHAIRTGLLPAELRDVCESVGNSSLLGAIKTVFDGADLQRICDMARYIDLSADSRFSDLFMENMGF